MSWSSLRPLAVAITTAMGVAIFACSTDSGTQSGSCADGELSCNGVCVEPMTDTANCGGCGVQCQGAQLCSAGACSLTCSPGTTQCGTSCADIKVDPLNCGACGTACAVGQICSGGSCVAQCPSSAQTVCPGDAGVSCVSTATDSANCGGCGTVCAPGKVCSGGTCSDSCGAGETLCPAAGDAGAPYCAITQTDQDNCGSCGHVCATGLVCSGGTCQAQCAPPLILCGTQCVDKSSDRDNCGSCGKVCTGATPACSGGTCVSCGSDCWGSSGCLTAGGKCIKFMCRAGSAGPTFCSSCAGWTEITYSDWMTGGYCLDVFAKYNATEGNVAKCGSAVANCCGSSAGCSNQNAAWHFSDGSNTHYTGPCMTCGGSPNCSFFSGTDNSAYTRLSVCRR